MAFAVGALPAPCGGQQACSSHQVCSELAAIGHRDYGYTCEASKLRLWVPHSRLLVDLAEPTVSPIMNKCSYILKLGLGADRRLEQENCNFTATALLLLVVLILRQFDQVKVKCIHDILRQVLGILSEQEGHRCGRRMASVLPPLAALLL